MSAHCCQSPVEMQIVIYAVCKWRKHLRGLELALKQYQLCSQLYGNGL